MHRTPLPQTILSVICSFVLTAGIVAQEKAPGAIDITKCWTYTAGTRGGSMLASDAGRVYMDTSGAMVEALSLDGKKLWAAELGGDITSNIFPAKSGLFLVTTTVTTDPTKLGGSLLHSLSLETGVTKWTVTMPDAIQHYISSFGESLIVVSKNGSIESVDTKSGAVKWKRQIAEAFTAEPAYNRDKIFVATATNQIFEIQLATGEIDVMRKVPFGVTAVAKTASGELIVGDTRGNILSINAAEKPAWKFKTGGEITKILDDGEHLLVTSRDNFAYFLISSNGAVAWKKRLAGPVSQIANIQNKFALISSFEQHGAILAELEKGRISGQVLLAENETIVSPPVASNDYIFVRTNDASYAYSLGACAPKK